MKIKYIVYEIEPMEKIKPIILTPLSGIPEFDTEEKALEYLKNNIRFSIGDRITIIKEYQE